MRKYNWFYDGGSRVRTFEASGMEARGEVVTLMRTEAGEVYARNFVTIRLAPGDWIERGD